MNCALRLKMSLLKPKLSPMPGGPTRRADQTSEPEEFRIRELMRTDHIWRSSRQFLLWTANLALQGRV
jgi:hypothetical protein